MQPPTPDSKRCQTCGRPMAWRRKWARTWEQVKYCSAACRRGLSEVDRQLEHAILTLLAGRSASSSICPSEAARIVMPDGWRDLMEPARRAGRRLAEQGLVEFTQRGKVVDGGTARGPVRLRLYR